MARAVKLHVHFETQRSRPAHLQLTEAAWTAAARRHRAAARGLRVTFGWDGETLDAALGTADLMIGSNPPREPLYGRAPRLKWIQTTGAGVDGLLPLDWLPPEVVLTNNSGAHGHKAEDSCAMAITMLNARLPQVIANQQARAWREILSTPVAGKTVVIIGFGDLGRGAGRAARKLGAKVIAVTRSGRATRLADAVVPASRIERVLPKADFVVVTAPLTPLTRGILDRKRLDLLKPGAGLVNIARAALIDYDALRGKLVRGELAGAVLDVFETEPLPPASPWWTTPSTIIMPHISCDDPRYMERFFDFWFENLARFLAGKRLKNIVDRKLGY